MTSVPPGTPPVAQLQTSGDPYHLEGVTLTSSLRYSLSQLDLFRLPPYYTSLRPSVVGGQHPPGVPVRLRRPVRRLSTFHLLEV